MGDRILAFVSFQALSVGLLSNSLMPRHFDLADQRPINSPELEPSNKVLCTDLRSTFDGFLSIIARFYTGSDIS